MANRKEAVSKVNEAAFFLAKGHLNHWAIGPMDFSVFRLGLCTNQLYKLRSALVLEWCCFCGKLIYGKISHT